MIARHHPLVLPAALLAVSLLSTSCSKPPAEPPKASGPTVFKAQTAIPVNLTLLKAEGQTGRSSAISSNYRPQVRFPLGAIEASCVVQLPATTPALEPGASSSASLSCDAEVQVDRAQPQFVVVEGGKQVGQGTVQLP